MGCSGLLQRARFARGSSTHDDSMEGHVSLPRPYGETKDQDPTLRKFFTRKQNVAIQKFGL